VVCEEERVWALGDWQSYRPIGKMNSPFLLLTTVVESPLPNSEIVKNAWGKCRVRESGLRHSLESQPANRGWLLFQRMQDHCEYLTRRVYSSSHVENGARESEIVAAVGRDLIPC
jgi:hypothetical protein